MTKLKYNKDFGKRRKPSLSKLILLQITIAPLFPTPGNKSLFREDAVFKSKDPLIFASGKKNRYSFVVMLHPTSEHRGSIFYST